ncbi:TetR/AcrR family transcriptional regulator [Streptomyces flaveolus]|uniref:TetR/AcrR family transcriptional regulator n=1 Tax=Streptomyces flaveolus TaxID=67297 RepID=UPI0033307FF9
MEEQITDGRRRKGERRRRQLLDATMRLIERDGLPAVSQRSVAQEAGVPASAVTYYFPTVDDLLVTALTACNQEYLRCLDECASAEDPIGRLAALITNSASSRRVQAAAECELFLMAARRADLRPEAARWTNAVDAYLAPYIVDPVRRAGAVAAVDGLFLRCLSDPIPPDSDAVLAILETLIRPC